MHEKRAKVAVVAEIEEEVLPLGNNEAIKRKDIT